MSRRKPFLTWCNFTQLRIKCEYTVYADIHRGGSGGGKQPLCTVYAVSVK